MVNGANETITNDEGKTPSQIALREQQREMRKLFNVNNIYNRIADTDSRASVLN